MNGRERVLGAIEGKRTDSLPHIPISMMIAARTIGVKYGEYIHSAATHARGQLAFAEKWDIDHVSAISCPTTEAADLGADVIYYDDQPPAIDEENALLQEKGQLKSLKLISPGRRMTKRLETLQLLKTGAGGAKVVEGWVEGPVAEASDLRGINRVMMDFYDDPGFLHDLFSFVFENAMSFARMQKDAGAEIMGVGDAASSLVGPDLYTEQVMDWQKKYVDTLHAMGLKVRLHICGNITPILPSLKNVDADVLDLDSMVDVGEARRHLGFDRVLSGNLDPVRIMRNASPKDVEAGFSECFSAAGGRGYAVNAGCELPRDTPDDNLESMRYFARNNSPVSLGGS